MKGFEVYLAELIDTAEVCVARNIHKRSREEIEKVSEGESVCVSYRTE